MRQVSIPPDLAGFQRAAKWLLHDATPPHHVEWIERGAAQASLFSATEEFASDAPGELSVSRGFVEVAGQAACHRSGLQWALLYRVLWRLLHGERNLMKITVDPDVRSLVELKQQVHHDAHHMLAFVRFRELKAEQRYVAWYRPDHRVLRRVAPLFVTRLRAMQWSIFTPDECAHWDGRELLYSAGVERELAPSSPDHMEDLWREYYRSTFNPARANEGLMRQLMPARYWEAMPEAEVIHETLATSAARVQQMMDSASSEEKPRRDSLNCGERVIRPRE